MDRIKLLIVDDHTIFRMGLRDALSERETLEIVGEASDGNEAVEKARALKPHLVLMDLWMPNCTGVEATRRLQAEMPEVNILVLTISDRDEDLFGAIKAGARGYLLKNEEPEQLAYAIQHVASGGAIVSASLATRMLNEFKSQQPEDTAESNPSLSRRESEVLELVAKGARNKEIAASLFISENTVKAHLRRILDTLHLVNRSQAVAYAVRTGLGQGAKESRN